jgi:RsiW-degrading membrane proteinase PrsW (M82 family)
VTAVAAVAPAATVARGHRFPPRRWLLVLLGLDFALVIDNANWLARLLLEAGEGFGRDPGELVWVEMTGIVLGLVVAAPALLIIGAAARRANISVGFIPLGMGLGGAIFLAEGGRLHGFVYGLLGVGVSGRVLPDIGSVVLAPLIEEPTKLLAIVLIATLLWPRFGVRQGIVVGAIVGLAFNVFEAGFYVQREYAFGDGAIYGTVLATRFGLFGLGLHAGTAAFIGAGLGAALRRPVRRGALILVAALGGAIVTHGAGNLTGATVWLALVKALVPNPDMSLGEPIPLHLNWIASSVGAALLITPLFVLLVVAWRRGAPRRLPPPADQSGKASAPRLESSSASAPASSGGSQLYG